MEPACNFKRVILHEMHASKNASPCVRCQISLSHTLQTGQWSGGGEGVSSISYQFIQTYHLHLMLEFPLWKRHKNVSHMQSDGLRAVSTSSNDTSLLVGHAIFVFSMSYKQRGLSERRTLHTMTRS